MKRTPAALLVLLAWAALLGALGLYAQRGVTVSSDLRLFLPTPRTAAQRLLLREIGEGPASRVLIVALHGAPPAALAATSRALVSALDANPSFAWIANGDFALDAVPDELLPYRYLLSPALDEQPFAAKTLHDALTARQKDLSSPAGLLLEPLLPRDPTLETLALLERWQPARGPRREFDVWFDSAGTTALLLAATHAPAFDPDAQRAALDALEAAFAASGHAAGATLEVSGTGAFTVLMEGRTRHAVQAVGTADSIIMVLLLLIAYRSLGAVVLGALPLATAGLVGLAAVGATFGAVHGITLAFGFTLIGVAQDYPLHLLSHRRPDRTPADVARRIWPTLATGVASTCIAYLTFLFSGVLGLAQVAVFTVAGLAAAGLTTRFALPVLMDARGRDFGGSARLARLSAAIAALPRPRAAALVLSAAAVLAVALSPAPLWDNDLANLTPVPAPLVARDRELREQLGAADARYLLVVDAPDNEAALGKLEALDPQLRTLVERGAIEGYDHAARYLPSAATQRARQARLPDAAALRAALAAAQAGTGFRPDAFAPFLADVETARTLPPLTPAALAATPLAPSVDTLLTASDAGALALVTVRGVRDANALAALAASSPGTTFLDLRAQSEALVVEQRERILASLGVAALLLTAVVAVALRSRARVLRVLAPMAVTTAVVVGALQAAGVALNLFHLISLVLVAGLGLDYALFFEHSAADPAEQRRTLHAVVVCSLSTWAVFALLAASGLPVLRAIGIPVAIGVASNFVLALLLTRPGPARREHPH